MAALNFEGNFAAGAKINGGSFAILTELPGTSGVFPAEPPLDPNQSNFIVQTDQNMRVKLHWTTEGVFWAVLNGKWNCKVYLEEMGAGEFAGPPFSATVAVVNSIAPTPYNVTVSIPANTIPAGLYRFVVAITLQGPAPANLPLPVAAFSDIGIVHLFETV
jgi:hypothetical protein